MLFKLAILKIIDIGTEHKALVIICKAKNFNNKAICLDPIIANL